MSTKTIDSEAFRTTRKNTRSHVRSLQKLCHRAVGGYGWTRRRFVLRKAVPGEVRSPSPANPVLLTS